MKPTFQQIQHPPIHASALIGTKQKQGPFIANGGFSEQLREAAAKTEKLSISKHATMRLQQRGIDISQETWDKVNEKTNEAKKKGITDSLVLLDNAALIVSAKNKVVVTAMGRNEAAGQIFTNINGTILID